MLLDILRRDPTSWLCSELNGWKHPASYEYQVLADLFDVQHMSKTKKAKPRERPWSKKPNRIGAGQQATQDVLNKLEQMNPKETNG
jgi:hypothetical protein